MSPHINYARSARKLSLITCLKNNVGVHGFRGHRFSRRSRFGEVGRKPNKPQIPRISGSRVSVNPEPLNPEPVNGYKTTKLLQKMFSNAKTSCYISYISHLKN